MKYAPVLAALLIATAYPALAQKPKKPKTPVKPPAGSQNTTQGTKQQQGGDGVFKSVYTLTTGINFTLISGRYTVEPVTAYAGEIAGPEEKFLVLTVAIKNSNAIETFFSGEDLTFNAVDDTGQNHEGNNYRLNSTGVKGFAPTLKPGQGAGQEPDKDELTVSIKMPADARISKIIMNKGRKFVPGEQVVRYFVANVATKERDGAEGNPKNVLMPLPVAARDASDTSGVKAAPVGAAKLGEFVPTGYGSMRVDSVTTPSTEKLDDADPEDGKQYAIATITAKNIYGRDIPLFDLVNGDGVPELKDADGEKYMPAGGGGGIRKPKADAGADLGLKLAHGETYTFRYIFIITKGAKLKSLTFGQPSGHHYIVQLP